MDATVTSKGQITIPKPIRDHLKVKAGDRVKIFIQPDGHVVLLPVVPMTALKGLLKTTKRATVAEMDEAIREGAVARYRRATGK